MPTNRKFIFANDEIYHVYNRGVEKRPTFTHRKEFSRAIEAMRFYQYANPPMGFSKFLSLNKEIKTQIQDNLLHHSKLVQIIAYCLMPNHFHFLLKQITDKGISKFVSQFTNSYTKYFNLRNEREGHLFQGLFKAVYIEDNEQLLHISRYIHLNPVASFLIKPEELAFYKWSSYPEYMDLIQNPLSTPDIIINQFSSRDNYKTFVLDQVDYARTLEMIKHLCIE